LGYKRDAGLVLRLAAAAGTAPNPRRRPDQLSAGFDGDRASVSVALTTLASGLSLPAGRNKVLIGELDFPTIGH